MNLLLAAKHTVVFVICSLLGYIVSSFIPEGAWSTSAYLLVTYHLFLEWLAITANYEKDLSLPIGSIILIHLSCLTLVLCIGIGVRSIPLIGLSCYIVPALGVFEIKWLFLKGKKKKEIRLVSEKAAAAAASRAAAVAAAVSAAATVDDYQDWLRYLAQPDRPPRKPGTSVEDEYKQWLLERAKSRIAPHPKR